MPVTVVSNHNGAISNEARVIYVVHQRTSLPLFMRYVPGNVIDALTIRRTRLELEGMGSSVGFALLDAGYYNSKNADALYDAKISFVTRVHNNNKVFVDAVKMYRIGLESKEKLVRYNGGLYYIRQVMLGIKSNRKVYGYLCLDLTAQSKELYRIALIQVIRYKLPYKVTVEYVEGISGDQHGIYGNYNVGKFIPLFIKIVYGTIELANRGISFRYM